MTYYNEGVELKEPLRFIMEAREVVEVLLDNTEAKTTKTVNVYCSQRRQIRCIANEHDYLGDGTKKKEPLEVGKLYTLERAERQSYGEMVFIKELPSNWGFQAYLFEEIEEYDEEILHKARERELENAFLIGENDIKHGRYRNLDQVIEEPRRES